MSLPYSIEDLPDLYRKAGVLPIERIRSRQPLWVSYGYVSVILGGVLTLIGASMIPVEVARIIEGSLNLGNTNAYYLYPNYNADKNADSTLIQTFEKGLPTNLANKGIVPFSATAPPGKTGSNYPVQDKYIWPWSHPALLFSLVTITAGSLGILSGFRRTYTSIYAYFALSLLSLLLAPFLIGYFAVIAHWHFYFNDSRKDRFDDSNIDYTLSLVMQVLSIASFFISLMSVVYAGISGGICPCQSSKAPLVKDDSVRLQNKRLFIYYY